MNNFECLDCNIDTESEYYVVKTAVWISVNPKILGMLCIGCLEKRLDRKLTSSDFTFAPINTLYWQRKSDRLKNRLTSN